jgi:hypothetical protein
MKYYLYISETKVGMLHGQVRTTLFSKIKAGLKIKLPFLFEASLDADSEQKDIYAKVEELRNKILAGGECGTIERPKSYIDDTATLSFGRVADYAASIAFFGGTVGSKKVALIGSPSSLVGAGSTDANHSLDYYTIKFIRDASAHDQSDDLDMRFRAAVEYSQFDEKIELAVDEALKSVIGPPRRLAFTAKLLHTTPTLVLASPIFVALA